MKKILVCDDDESITEVIKIVLENNNYQVRLIHNGRGIQKKLLEYKPDLILLDLWMPGIEGEEIIKILKSEKETSKIPIIIISALNDMENTSKRVGADGFLSKPFDIDELVRVVNKVIR